MKRARLGCRSERTAENALKHGMSLPVREPGWIESVCEDCGDAVWIGPQQQRVVLEDPSSFEIMCMMCVAERMAQGEPVSPRDATAYNARKN